MTRMYDGELASTAEAAAIPLTRRGARPQRSNAFGETLTDGPYGFVNGADASRASVSANSDAEATITLQGCNGDPSEGEWFDLESVVVDGETSALLVSDLAVLWLRVVAEGAANVTVEVVVHC